MLISLTIRANSQDPGLRAVQEAGPDTDRYVLADLYAMLDDRENHKLIPITDNMNMTLRCYTISTTNTEESGALKLVVQGMLDKT